VVGAPARERIASTGRLVLRSSSCVRSMAIAAASGSRANGASAWASAAAVGMRASRSFSRQRRITACKPRGIRGSIAVGGSVATRNTTPENVSASNGRWHIRHS